MKWNRQTTKTVVIVFLVLIVTLFFIKWTFDHDGETIEIGGVPPSGLRPPAG